MDCDLFTPYLGSLLLMSLSVVFVFFFTALEIFLSFNCCFLFFCRTFCWLCRTFCWLMLVQYWLSLVSKLRTACFPLHRELFIYLFSTKNAVFNHQHLIQCTWTTKDTCQSHVQVFFIISKDRSSHLHVVLLQTGVTKLKGHNCVNWLCMPLALQFFFIGTKRQTPNICFCVNQCP